MQRKLNAAKEGRTEPPQMEVDDSSHSSKQLEEEMAEAEADIKFLQEQLKKNPSSASRAAQLESRKAEAAALKQQRWDSEDPMLQLRGKSQKILRLTDANRDHLAALRKVLQTIEDAEDQEEEIRKKMASNQTDIQRLRDESAKLQIAGGDLNDPKRLEGAWTVIQQKFSQHFDAPTVSENVQRLRQPLEEAFLTIKQALNQMAQADTHASSIAGPAAAVHPSPDAAATTEAGVAPVQQHQQQLAMVQHQQQQQALALQLANEQQQQPVEANATTEAGNALLQVHQQQLLHQQQQAVMLQQQTAINTAVEAPGPLQAAPAEDAVGTAPVRRKQADCTDEQLMALGSRNARRAENKPY